MRFDDPWNRVVSTDLLSQFNNIDQDQNGFVVRMTQKDISHQS